MHGLRWIFLMACLGCVAIVAWNGRWEERLTLGNHTWIVDLGQAPIWAPPPEPELARFQKYFDETEDFPAEGTANLTFQRVLKLDWMVAHLLLYLWLVTAATGLLYIALRKQRRDLILHLGLWAGIGVTAGAAVCMGMWLVFGGWGPPAPGFFGGLGLLVGVLVGLGRFKRGYTEPYTAADRPRD